MDTGSSVSKGCFAYKGKRKRVNPADYFKACEHPVSGDSRQSTCDLTWEEIDQEIQILRSDLNSKIFDDLLAFTSSCHEKFSLDHDQDHKDSFVTEIPTAALVTGVNTPDHGVMFSTLVELLHERVSPLVAILRSKDCNKVKNVLTKTLGQLLQNPDMFTDEEEDSIANTKNLPCTLSTLSAWYNTKYKLPHSPTKKRKSVTISEHQRYPPIVIVFEDLESWVPQILQDFITICSNYIHHLPIVFVFGIATSVAAVHRLLPNTVSSLLCMEKFQAPPSTEYLTLVINQIIMTSKFPFKLGSKVFQLLLDIFLYHDFSVLNFIKGLQFCILDHFFSFPCSRILCHHEDLHQTIKDLKHHDIESVRMAPSFMRYVESSQPKQQIDLLENDDYTKNIIEKFMSQINKYHELFFPVLRCLHCLVSKLPKHPLGKQLREVYSMTLGSFICETEQYKDAIELLKMMSKDELTDLMKAGIQELGQDLHDDLQNIPQDLERFLQRFDTLHEIPEEEEENDSQEESTLHLEKTDLHNLRKKLMEAGKKSKKLSPYEKLRLEIVDYYDNVFRKYMSCPKSFPLHEVFYYDSAADVKRQLNSSPRSAVQTALATPHHYLQCKCCDMEPGIISSTMPDLCIVYKLHLECTQLINLFDWLQAFVTVVTTGEEEEEGKKKAVDKVLQARFIRAVSELQFLGFIKPTKRKTDHVARLTWGGC